MDMNAMAQHYRWTITDFVRRDAAVEKKHALLTAQSGGVNRLAHINVKGITKWHGIDEALQIQRWLSTSICSSSGMLRRARLHIIKKMMWSVSPYSFKGVFFFLHRKPFEYLLSPIFCALSFCPCNALPGFVVSKSTAHRIKKRNVKVISNSK